MANEFDDLFNGGLDSKMDFLNEAKTSKTANRQTCACHAALLHYAQT